ncbi:MAG: hypothetical protein U0531_03425 [Dehalococcoidia bacterium]
MDDSPELLATLDAFLAHDYRHPALPRRLISTGTHSATGSTEIARLAVSIRAEDAAQLHAARLLRRLKNP